MNYMLTLIKFKFLSNRYQINNLYNNHKVFFHKIKMIINKKKLNSLKSKMKF